MHLPALITLDLIEATATEQARFDQILMHCGWLRLAELTTAWTCRKQKTGRHTAILAIEKDLKYAKDLSMISRVDYAIQLCPEAIHQSFI